MTFLSGIRTSGPSSAPWSYFTSRPRVSPTASHGRGRIPCCVSIPARRPGNATETHHPFRMIAVVTLRALTHTRARLFSKEKPPSWVERVGL